MNQIVRSAAVLGAGTMGAQIAAHLANADVPVTLFDVSEEAARKGLDRLKSLKPDPWFTSDAAARVRMTSFDRLGDLSHADWIVEAVIEDLDVKRDLLKRVSAAAAPDAMLSSNTSGIPIHALAEALPETAASRFLGTHFFNPPRYLPLVEIIATPSTNSRVTKALFTFLDHRLGKGIVPAHDAPGFIANRLGIFGACRALEGVAKGSWTIEEIDAVTGPAIGRPRSATFRTLDIAGLDIFATVARDLAQRLGGVDGAPFSVPPFVSDMLAHGQLGEKSGKGFYERTRSADGASRIRVLDITTLEYRDQAKGSLPVLETLRPGASAAERVRALFQGRDRAGELLRQLLSPTLVYAAAIAQDIADSIDDIDRAMRWGFGWELGPFELWDAIGVSAILDACQLTKPPALVQNLLAEKRARFRETSLPPADTGRLILQVAASNGKVIKANAGAQLVDLGDGVLCVEFRSKMNTIGGDTIAMLQTGLTEAAAQTALVIGGEADVFSAGANLMLLLLEAQEGNWDEVDQMVRQFQRMTMAIKQSAVPVIAAPAGLALGGGCEICLHADRVQAAAETYLGLVEVGVGLIPAGGGTKEMLLRALDRATSDDQSAAVRSAFETMALGKVSTSGPDARRLGYLRQTDDFTMNRERVIAAAKARAIERARDYHSPARRLAIPVGGADLFAVLALGVHLAWRAGQASDHDALVGRTLARVMTGGDLPHATTVSEDYLLDLEREAFLRLCGERKTLERIGHTLKSGKPLKN